MFSRFFMYNLLDKYEVFLYFFQQYLYKFLFISDTFYIFFSPFILLMLGFTTVLTPCFLSILPLIVSYANSQVNKPIKKSLFIFGLVNSYIIIIILSNFFDFYLLLSKLPTIAFVIIFLVSLNLMQVINFSFFYTTLFKNIFVSKNYSIYFYSYFMGIFISFSSLPCNTSIIFLVILWLKSLNNFFIFLLYLLVYLFGCIMPLYIVLYLKSNYKDFDILVKIWNLIFPLSGSFLFIFSLLSLLKIIFI
uniref:Thiol:disulfide interchange protein n=1 Tax=Ophidocladus simpliciusculus TaxID=1261574 RepID=A0A1Z1MIP8_9FLOR|nr:thiol:disulfide interchange protein [Ophidocladus simpliciusculus]ARW65923.1 thiol:disulfide interchange protein [Ophidocladus simpliciusculus]